MARYMGRQSVYNASLDEYQQKGFRLVPNGDHFLNLYYQDNLVASFSQTGATIYNIRLACRMHLLKLGVI